MRYRFYIFDEDFTVWGTDDAETARRLVERGAAVVDTDLGEQLGILRNFPIQDPRTLLQ